MVAHDDPRSIGGGLALGIDIGTSGVRAALLRLDGECMAFEARRFPADSQRDPAAWRQSLAEALLALPGPGRVRAVAVDGTSGTMLAVDGSGEPIGPPIMYDERVADADLVARLDGLAPKDGVARGSGSAAARACVLAGRPGAVRVLHQADWIVGLLTGRLDRSDETNVLKTGYDPIARAWPDWLGEAGVPVELLPEVVPVGEPLAELSSQGAAFSGLRRGTTVVAGTTDGCASFLATGASRPGDGVTALGSTLVIKLLSDRPVFAPAYGVYSHRVGNMWLAGGASNTGGRVLAAHFRPEEIEELSAGIDPAADVAEACYPLLEPGERFPRNDAALAPVMPRSTDPSVRLHAMLDGMARIEAEGYARLATLGAPDVTRVLTVGGGAANAAWSALRARHLSVPVESAQVTEAAIGTARIALAHMREVPLDRLVAA